MRTVRAFAQENKELAAYTDKIDNVLKLSYKDALARGIMWGTVSITVLLLTPS
jgi:ATP-binding cassette subfamily B (MDR/TAP) protein 10